MKIHTVIMLNNNTTWIVKRVITNEKMTSNIICALQKVGFVLSEEPVPGLHCWTESVSITNMTAIFVMKANYHTG